MENGANEEVLGDLWQKEVTTRSGVAKVESALLRGNVAGAVQSATELELCREALKAVAIALSVHKSIAALHIDDDLGTPSTLAENDELMDMISRSHFPRRLAQGFGAGGSLMSFGKNDYQLGYVLSEKTMTTSVPKRLDFSSVYGTGKIVRLAASGNHTMAIDSYGQVWSWGHGLFGRLGHGDECTRISPTRVEFFEGEKVTEIATGRDHSMAVTTRGELFTWGSNEKGQLGIGGGNTSAHLPRRVKSIRDEVVSSENQSTISKQDQKHGELVFRNVAASTTHSLALDSVGRVYSWGANDKGQLGAKDVSGIRREPKVVGVLSGKAIDGISKVCASDGVSIVLSNIGQVFQFGHGSPIPMRVSIRSTQMSNDVTSKDSFANLDSKDEWKFDTRDGECSVIVSDISCGPNHAAAISTDGHLYTWGSHAILLGHAAKGCDRTQQSHTTKPKRVEALLSARITSVACGKKHTCAVDSLGNLYTWGIGDDGILGTTRTGKQVLETYQPVPQRVSLIKQVSQVAVSDSHTFVLITAASPVFRELTIQQHMESGYGLPSGTEETTEVVMAEKEIEQPELETHSDSDEDLDDWNIIETVQKPSTPQKPEGKPDQPNEVPSLQLLCERRLSKFVTLWNVLPIWQTAKSIWASSLQLYCESFVFLNLDAVLALHHSTDVEAMIIELCDGDLAHVEHLVQQSRSAPSASASIPSPACQDRSWDSWEDEPIRNEGVEADLSDSPHLASANHSHRSTAGLVNSIKVMSVPRLRKRLSSYARQLEAVKDRQLQLFSSSPSSSSIKARKMSQALDAQLEDICHSIKLIEGELESRVAGEMKPAPNSLHADSSASDTLVCDICQVRVQSTEAMIFHIAGKRHRKNQSRHFQEESQTTSGISHTAEPNQLTKANKNTKWKPLSPFTESPPQSPVTPAWAKISAGESQAKISFNSPPVVRRNSSAKNTSFSPPSSFPPLSPFTPISTPQTKSARSFATLALPVNATESSGSASKRSLTLSDFIPHGKGKGPTPVSPSPAWMLDESGVNKARSQVLNACAKVNLGAIQSEQMLESSKKGRSKSFLVTESSWGRQHSDDVSLADIQQQQFMEMESLRLERELDLESERLARELAAMEGVDQRKILGRASKAKSETSTNKGRQNGKPRNRHPGKQSQSGKSGGSSATPRKEKEKPKRSEKPKSKSRSSEMKKATVAVQ